MEAESGAASTVSSVVGNRTRSDSRYYEPTLMYGKYRRDLGAFARQGERPKEFDSSASMNKVSPEQKYEASLENVASGSRNFSPVQLFTEKYMNTCCSL